LTTNSEPLANRLGALALRITDRMHAAVSSDSRSLSSATALSALDRFLDAPSIDQLSSVLGLSSSATVRLVDRLVADGYATRASTTDGRVSVVELTGAGRRAAARIVAARADLLEGIVASLSVDERTALHELVETLLVELIRGPATKAWMCRLCDTQACGAPPGQPCPVTVAALVERPS
jgi:DNA-binding MarR family transcriptional regulator